MWQNLSSAAVVIDALRVNKITTFVLLHYCIYYGYVVQNKITFKRFTLFLALVVILFSSAEPFEQF